jgi:lauroyl/myristoyl acyltransferase
LKTALIRALRLIAGRWPRFGFSLARGLAFLSRPLGRGISEHRLAEAFPRSSPAELAAVRRDTWRHFLQDEALESSLARTGWAPRYPRVAPDSRLARLSPPLILASFHIGPIQAVGAVLERLPGEVLVLHRGRFAPRPGLTLLRIGADEWDRARAFRRAITTLLAGGTVYLAMDGLGSDGYDAATVEAPLLGGTARLARGAFALSRITGAPLVPVLARWRGSRAEIVSGDPIPASADESAMAAATARWLERYLLDSPGQISLRTLEILHPQAPRAGRRAARGAGRAGSFRSP